MDQFEQIFHAKLSTLYKNCDKKMKIKKKDVANGFIFRNNIQRRRKSINLLKL